jgi:general secretion pathway protein G
MMSGYCLGPEQLRHLSQDAGKRPPWTEIQAGRKTPIRCRGMTLLELLALVGIIGTLVSILIPAFNNVLEKGRISRAVSDIATIGQRLNDIYFDSGDFPENLDELERINPHDPWGRPYQYLKIMGKDKNEIKGKWRKDRFLVPLNSDYDLYSMGKDGRTVAPITAKASHDDILRADNGSYMGLASKY